MNIFLDQQEQSTESRRSVIINSCRNQETNVPATVIYNDDEIGLSLIRLMMLIEQEGLKERHPFFRAKALKNIEPGDFIIFGEKSTRDEEFDFQVVKDPEYVMNLDARRFKTVYSLKADLSDLVDRLTKTKAKKNPIVQLRKALRKEPETTQVKITANVKINEVSNMHYQPEKVTIFANWVKIGFHQYTITKTYMADYITLESGKRLYIAEDTLGRKVLVE